MVDDAYADPGLAEWYDTLNPWGASDDFYLGLVMSAGAVLDVGCGTGALLHRARERGHPGRLCGLDPAAAMLDRARACGRTGIEWVCGGLGDGPGPAALRGSGRGGGFDLIVMTGHAFQVLLDDAALRDALAFVRGALADGGRFAFETRHPSARPWERWAPEHAVEVTRQDGVTGRTEHLVATPVEGQLVRFTTTFTTSDRERPRTGRSTLRFLPPAALSAFLADAGLTAVEQYGDWDRSPLTGSSPEIITLAAVSPGPRPSAPE
ncbi:class I SAM-dependent DNA methyltransferase [Streptomyces pinistramenti]|uniref:class I SAM-dependent DNA methyltransferase n=1 Tax=Streptomyces pinistramenti TaxID=2884812 RepID=UPI001D0833A6|nr:class I SAM-dependent methyltransferase [Streptomyces pinistramenti]MCB5909006.1 class I SAM-dependent methyltransferase [Streptomyces pinistramenti]